MTRIPGQVFGNKPKYAGKVRQVGLNILPMRGSIRSYHMPSQSRSQNQGHASFSREYISSAIKRALESERVERKRAIQVERTKRDRALKAERARHKVAMDEVLATQSQIMSRFSQMESMWRQSVSVPMLFDNTATLGKNFTPHVNVELSIGSGSSNNL
jgi:hypothetical protein